MIPLRTILDQLHNGEYKLTSLVDRKEKAILPSKWNSVIVMINAALTDIHTRFVVRNSQLRLRISHDVLRYNLVKENAISNNSDGFILDSDAMPYTGDLLRINGLYTDTGSTLLLNQLDRYVPESALNNWSTSLYGARDGYIPLEYCHYSFHTPVYNELIKPRRLDDCEIIVDYRCNAPLLEQIKDEDLATVDANAIYIELPTGYTNAITYYVASRFSNGLGAETIGRGIFHQGNNYYQKYVQECEVLQSAGIEVVEDIDMNYALSNKGFV